MSDEKKDVNSQQENVGKKGINKKLIIAFAGMGAVIVGLVIALILVATSGKKDVDSSASGRRTLWLMKARTSLMMRRRKARTIKRKRALSSPIQGTTVGRTATRS